MLPLPNSGTGRFKTDHLIKPVFQLSPGCRIELNGLAEFRSDHGESGTSYISLGKHATLIIDGDFVIGPNVKIIVSENATLRIGGRLKSSGSGITSDSRILVRNRVDIGSDTIIAWDVLITDSDWHSITGTTSTIPCKIGNHVWIAHGASILKGARISDGSIVAAQSLCMNTDFPENSLIAGTPAKVLKTDVSWNRELI